MTLKNISYTIPDKVLNPGDNVVTGYWVNIFVMGETTSAVTAIGYKDGVPKTFTPIPIEGGINFDIENEGFDHMYQGWYIDVNVDGVIYKVVGNNDPNA